MKVVTDGGEVIDLGTTETTPTIGIVDYSRRETDGFGVTTVVERGFARRMSVRALVPFDAVDTIQRRLAGLRATPALWVADDRFASLSVRGFYKDFSLDLAVPSASYCTLEVEGLTATDLVADPGGDPAPVGLASTLQLLQPTPVTDAVLAASNVAEVDYAEWSATTTYAQGARVIKAAAHRIYESVAAGNKGADPAGADGKWLDIGPTNRWAMFDQALGSFTTAGGGILVTLNAGIVDAVALLDVVGETVQVQAGAYQRTIAVGAGAITFLDLPRQAGPVTVLVTGGQVSVGTLLVGRLVALGVTEASPTAGITDFSRKEVDDFGEVTVVQRAWAKRMTANALLRTDVIDIVANRIAAVRARPALWIGQTGLDSLTVYGFFKDFSIEVGETVSKLSLSIEGMSKAAQTGPGLPTLEALKALEDLIGAARAAAADKSKWFYQSTAPSAAESAPGDYWINTADQRRTYRRVEGSGRVAIGGNAVTLGGRYVTLPWTLAEDQRIGAAIEQALGAQATADGKAKVFIMASAADGEPVGEGFGDLLIRLYTSPVQTDTWNGSAWVASATYGATAPQAQSIATSKAAIDAITSDDVLARGEKAQFGREWQEARTRWNALDAKAATFGNVAVARGALSAAYSALTVAIGTIAPPYNDPSQDSPLGTGGGAALQAKWAAFYTAFAALDMAVTGQTLIVQWSATGLGNWHGDYANGDKYQRQSVDGAATWGPAIKVVGEDGADGDNAAVNGQFKSFVYKRAAAQPAVPTSDVTPPAGWSDAPPPQTAPPTALWQASADFRDATRLTAWAAPIKLIAADLADLDPSAAQLLTQAKAVADGKNRVFRQAAAPSAAASQENDLWINTADGNRTYVRVAGSGRVSIGGNAVTLGGGYVSLCWAEAPDARIGTAIEQVAQAIQMAGDADAKADDALASISVLADDDLLSPVEKQWLIVQDAKLEGAWAALDALAGTWGVTTERTAAAAARGAWQAYRDALTPPISDTATATPLSGVIWRAKLGAYENAIEALRVATVQQSAKRAEWDGVTGAGKDQLLADAAAAKANATAALQQIGVIQSDGYLAAGEKRDIIAQVADIQNEYGPLVAKAATQVISSTSYQAAYVALIAYLNTLTPAWNNTALDTAIVPATFNGKFSDYYYARTQLFSASADLTAANQVAVAILSSIDMPADYTGAVAVGTIRSLLPTVKRGGVDIRTADTTTYTLSGFSGGCTSGNVTVDNTNGSASKGQVSITATSGGGFNLYISVGGVLVNNYPITVYLVRGQAPSGGGSGTSGYVKSGNFSAIGKGITSTTFAEVGRISNMQKAAGQTIYATFSGSYDVVGGQGSNAAYTKWQYSAAGAEAWTDLPGGAAQGTYARNIYNGSTGGPHTLPQPDDPPEYDQSSGAVTCNRSAAPADGNYDLRLLNALTAANPRLVFNDGTAAVEIKV